MIFAYIEIYKNICTSIKIIIYIYIYIDIYSCILLQILLLYPIRKHARAIECTIQMQFQFWIVHAIAFAFLHMGSFLFLALFSFLLQNIIRTSRTHHVHITYTSIKHLHLHIPRWRIQQKTLWLRAPAFFQVAFIGLEPS